MFTWRFNLGISDSVKHLDSPRSTNSVVNGKLKLIWHYCGNSSVESWSVTNQLIKSRHLQQSFAEPLMVSARVRVSLQSWGRPLSSVQMNGNSAIFFVNPGPESGGGGGGGGPELRPAEAWECFSCWCWLATADPTQLWTYFQNPGLSVLFLLMECNILNFWEAEFWLSVSQ